MDSYNGFNHEQRVRQWAAVKVAIKLGILQPADKFKCSICGKDNKKSKIVYHTEDYASLYGDYPVCDPCHRKIHLRFIYPQMWLAVLKEYGNGGRKWFEKISLHNKD